MPWQAPAWQPAVKRAQLTSHKHANGIAAQEGHIKVPQVALALWAIEGCPPHLHLRWGLWPGEDSSTCKYRAAHDARPTITCTPGLRGQWPGEDSSACAQHLIMRSLHTTAGSSSALCSHTLPAYTETFSRSGPVRQQPHHTMVARPPGPRFSHENAAACRAALSAIGCQLPNINSHLPARKST